jgi:hypothetical protein
MPAALCTKGAAIDARLGRFFAVISSLGFVLEYARRHVRAQAFGLQVGGNPPGHACEPPPVAALLRRREP